MILEGALLLFVVTAFFGRLVIQRMVNSGVRALLAYAEFISGCVVAHRTPAFPAQSYPIRDLQNF